MYWLMGAAMPDLSEYPRLASRCSQTSFAAMFTNNSRRGQETPTISGVMRDLGFLVRAPLPAPPLSVDYVLSDTAAFGVVLTDNGNDHQRGHAS
jgi:hypothetical protein